ncbi:hypothetical protein RRG08_058067 [Elysia crispata]|uniref:Uncharacterized protein n=1 Tax=Elysia crispata TaxID=231223 RepID=A0AAE1DWV3_9GAST|nr:hypothetical protein RRG08_058067 [Elysia crispata]
MGFGSSGDYTSLKLRTTAGLWSGEQDIPSVIRPFLLMSTSLRVYPEPSQVERVKDVPAHLDPDMTDDDVARIFWPKHSAPVRPKENQLWRMVKLTGIQHTEALYQRPYGPNASNL